MRNPILAIAISFALAAPCTALAGDKKEKTIDVQSYSFGVGNAGSMSTGAGTGSGRVEHPYIKQNPDGPKTSGSSTGPTKPPLPTTVPTTGVRH